MLHFYNRSTYPTYEAAKADGAVYVCEAPADESQVDSWGFNGGILCDAMNAVQAALQCAGFTDSMEAVLFDGDTRLIAWSDDDA